MLVCDVQYSSVSLVVDRHAGYMIALSLGLLDRFVLASAGFGRRLRAVRSEQWCWPTPSAEWNVRQLVNHMARGNFSYVCLLRGSLHPSRAMEQILDYPLGSVAGRQALAVRTTDSVVHTWDPARVTPPRPAPQDRLLHRMGRKPGG
jgi:hypothetical protein